MESSNKYKVNLEGKTIEIEKLPNGKFKIPEEVRKMRGAYSGLQVKPLFRSEREAFGVMMKGKVLSAQASREK